MDDYRLQTPEQVDISYTVAGLGSRFLALAIDSVLQFILLVLVYLTLDGIDTYSRSFRDWYVAIAILVFAVINYGYFLIFELLLGGRTPGKAAMKIRVVRMDGRAADASGIVVRNLVRLADSLPFLYIAGIVSMFINKDSRRLGDLAAGTVVIVQRQQATLSTILAQQQAAPSAATGLSNQEYAIVRDFMARRGGLTPEARAKLAVTIAAPLYEKLHIPYERRTDPEDFLAGLLQ